MTRKSNPIMIPLVNIENRFDVRTKLDDDRMVQLAGCYESGVALPPVQVIELAEGKYAYVDGRHRGAAREYCGYTDIAAIVTDNPNDPAELFARALQANYGGAKPPTRDDISHTIIRMLELGASQTAIRERLEFIPSGSLKAYIASGRSTIMKRRISKALDAIGDGDTIETASKKTGVPIDSLKDVVSGKKGKWGTGRTNEKEFCTSLKAHISSSLKATNTSISKKIEFMLTKVSDGEISYKEAYGVIRSWSEHLRKTGIRITDWRARLNAASGEIDKSVTGTAA